MTEGASTSPSTTSGAPSTGGTSEVSNLTGTNTGRGSDKGNRYRGNNNRRQNGTRGSGRGIVGSVNSGTTFKGREEAIKEHVYDITDTNTSASTFITTTEEIAEFAARTLKMGNLVKLSLEQMTLLAVEKPKKTTSDNDSGFSDEVDEAIYKEEIKSYVTDRKMFASSMQKAYSIIYGQCSDGVRAKVESMANHTSLSNKADPIGLLKNIKTVMSNFQTTKYMAHAILDCKSTMFAYRQSRDTTVAEYHKVFKGLVDVIEYNGGTIGNDAGMIDAHLISINTNTEEPTAEQTKLAVNGARDATVACAFVMGADKARFGKLIENLENDFTQGVNKYPNDLTDAYNLLTNWKQDVRNHAVHKNRSSGTNEVAFTNVGEVKDNSKVRCYNCQEMGHYSNKCNNEKVPQATGNDSSDVQLLMDAVEEGSDDEFAFHISDNGNKLPQSWILLDNQSTVNIFCNPKLLRNIRKSNRRVTVNCNAGVTSTNMIGDLKGYKRPVWFHPNGIANILSMSLLEEDFDITYTKKGGFEVHKDDGTIRRFVKSERGLFYMDTAKNNPESDATIDTTLVNTVANNKSNYTVKEYRLATVARKLQSMIGSPSLADYLRIVDNNELKNCPVTRRDVMAAEDIFGGELASLKGKTTRQSSAMVEIAKITLPPHIHERNKLVTIAVDVMFVNKVAFFVTISRGIKFGTVEHIANRQHDTIVTCIKKIRDMYRLGGFQLDVIMGDNEFASLAEPLSDIKLTVNAASDDEHVGEIERFIRTIKERVRCVWNTVPFKQIPNRMIIELVKNAVSWRNVFPANNGISTKYSPRTIVTGLQVDYRHHCRIQPGSYVQTHEKHDNSMKTRTIGAIALRPTNNSQGGYYFLSLSSGRRIDRRSWDELPMPDDVIARVHTLARRDKASAGLTFGWHDGKPILDTDEDDDVMADPDYDPIDDTNPEDSDNDEEYDEEEYMSDDDAPVVPIAGVIVPPQNDLDNELEADDIEEEEDAEEHDDDHEQINEPTQISDDESVEDEDMQPTGVDEDIQPPGVEDIQPPGVDNTDDQDEQDQGVRHVPTVETATNQGVSTVDAITEQEVFETTNSSRPHGLRPKKARNYDKHLHGPVGRPPSQGKHHTLLNPQDVQHVAMTQYSVKKGLKMFGAPGAEAVISEMKQLDTMDVIEPVSPRMLTREEKKAALEYLMFLKKKRCGRIKGRGCADGRKQRLYMSKEETSSPTVSTEAVLLSATIDAKEERDVATTDVPAAFMQTDMEGKVHVRLSGPLAELLMKVDVEKYQKFSVLEGGKRVIYVRLKKALYGTLQASLLFWKDLTGELKKWGFEINPYDECVANKMMNGKQCTVLWHVDDLKISHVDSQCVDEILNKLSERYGKDAPLVTTRGKVHDYLGMTLDYSIKGKVMVIMDDYEDAIMLEARDDIEGSANSPAGIHLHEVNTVNPKLLSEDDRMYFHTMTAKLLFLSKRSRPDLQQAVSFLTTRVRAPDEDDYKKLARVIKYLRTDSHERLTLEADDTALMKWWIDASFAVHPDMKSHTGATASLGKGSVYTTSVRQKLNTKSSTESELVAVDDAMPMILWTQYFLNAQGYKIDKSVVYQDNQSTMLLAKNGRASSGKRTRHINIRYFLVADRVKSGEISIEYCPTETMLADYLTKPLQGVKFRWFKNMVLNIQQKVRFSE